MAKTRLPVNQDHEVEGSALHRRAGAVIELALEQLHIFRADTSGQALELFLREHAGSDADVERAVREAVACTLALRGRRRA